VTCFDDGRLPARFWSKVSPDPNSGCWLWTACLNEGGYGVFSWRGKMHYAHRVAYAVLVGLIPDGFQCDHLCRARSCVNPDHIESVTQQENIRRGKGGQHQVMKTHCPQGHEYAGDNLYVPPGGGRECRECKREGNRRYRTKQRGYASQPNAMKTHCPAGHPYTDDNLYINPYGGRQCRACGREAGRRYRMKQKGEERQNG